MTDDLVKQHIEQLRLTGGDLADLCQPLADAIEQLTAEAAKMLSEADYKYNRKTNDMIQRHAEQVQALTAERDRLRAALRGLERASTEVASCGARTGPHWLKLTVANLSARAALRGETP
jgi:hypothetical protein